jgi:23S rRNA pseudouridine2605 synthase
MLISIDLKMNREENDGIQPRRKRIIPENQREKESSQEQSYDNRKPAYHANRDGSGYQSPDSNRVAPGRRPRISDSRSVNPRLPYGGNRTDEYRREGRPPSPPASSSSHYPPSSSSESGERRPFQQQYPVRSTGGYHPEGGGGRPPYQPRSPHTEQRSGGGYRRPQEWNNEGGHRPPVAGGNRYYDRTRSDGVRDSRDSRDFRDSRYPNKRPPQQRTENYNPNAKYNYQKQLKYKEALSDPNEPIRLNKFLANAGVCSRREADEFIQAGVVKVNDKVITELGTKITRQDKVLFHDRPVQIESKLYILLNKPKNCVTTSDDPQERLTVMDLVKNACKERIYPVGRLDRNTTGVLLLTNDGDLAAKLTHPSFKKKKIYHVWLDKEVALEDMEKLATGLQLDDGEIHADAISYANEEDKKQVGIEIHSGRNRIVRRMFESLGYRVVKLDRVYFAGLTKKNLPRGKWRYLDERDVNALRMGAFE